MDQKFFAARDNKQSINDAELNVLQFWKDNNIFQETVDSRHPNKPFVFFDGPPFATGTPHYGHILAGTIKDAIPRYWTMKGFRVERKFGWDCHGLPVEYQVEKEKNIGGKPGIEAMGVAPFNELCRSIVLRCRDEWEDTVSRMGRFVDFKNDYKTMDPEFMESVWWVFKELWDKDLIYEGHKVIAYSPKLGSPLSNFEANLNYQDIDDPAVTIKFKLKEGEYILAWTTTPWTLPSNCALGFGRDHSYALVEQEDGKYWVAADAVERTFGEDTKVLSTKTGKDFVGMKYEPLFDFFSNDPGLEPRSEDKSPGSSPKRFEIIHDDGDYVTTDSGTGIVHMAPYYGAEDDDLCKKFGIMGVNPIGDDGYFTDQTPPLDGKYFRYDPEVDGTKEDNANKWVIATLKETGQLFKLNQIRHSYPHCWRTDCALMYRGVKTWFVNIQKIKETIIAKNQDINWNPDHLKDGRFGKLLEGAPDWAISRNRYWGTPLPIWRCDKTGEIEVIGSREALEAKVGQPVEDLHKHFVDELTWKNKTTGGTMRRIEEVLDCWFESGSMPYASQHYPFNGEESFPTANFISEGMDQTRGWFYTLHVLGVALFGKNIFKNVMCSGIVLAEDGQKMSKSKKNYPDPNIVFEKYGADAIRFYLLKSPVTKGENLRFAKHEVEEVLKTLILPLRNAYQFLSLYANIDNWSPTKFTFVRHGEAEHNVKNLYSSQSGRAAHPLTDLGRAQAQETGLKLNTPDLMFASPLLRTRQTADILKATTGFGGEIHFDENLRENDFGNLDGTPYVAFDERLQNPTTEPLAAVQERVRAFMQEKSKAHPGASILCVSHGDPTRVAKAGENQASTDTERREVPQLVTGKSAVCFVLPESDNELDRWIISELQTLVAAYHENFTGYDLEHTCRLFPVFVDKLNNWYLRRNRSRFWAPGLSEDKTNGYQTLHYVLLTLSKLLAPICPFFAEELYQGLSNEPQRSVHCETLPISNPDRIDETLQVQTALTREVVRLAASIRSRQKIKLRQPLPALSFALNENTKLDLDLIAAEANVKTVNILENLEGVAQQIIKVDARKVGKKYGKKVQALIQAGKSGNFVMHENGQVKIEGETLEADEYTIGFITEGELEAEATHQVVVLLDTAIDEDLRIEGLAREIVRSIQDLRKSEGFNVSDKIEITFETASESLTTAFTKFAETIQTETLANACASGSATNEVSIEGETLKLTLKKA